MNATPATFAAETSANLADKYGAGLYTVAPERGWWFVTTCHTCGDSTPALSVPATSWIDSHQAAHA